MKKFLTVSIASLVVVALSFSIGCSKKGGSDGDPLEEMNGHMKAIFKILKDNTADCAKAVTEVKGYVDKNKASLESVTKHLEEMEKKMSEEDKKKYEEKKEKLGKDMLKESMATMMEFGQKCPQQMQEIGEVLKPFSPKK